MTLATPPARRSRSSQQPGDAGTGRTGSSSSSSSTTSPPPRPLLIVPSWIEHHCRIPDGFRRGEPVELYRWQQRWFVNVYLVRGDVEQDLRNPVLGPAFVHRFPLLIGPQGIGKNPTIAMQVCVEAVGPALFAGFAGADDGWACAHWGCGCGWEYPYDPGEPMAMAWPTPLIQITAFSEDSTSNTYDALRPMIELGPLAHVMPNRGEEFIRLPGGGRIDTVTSSNQSRLGQRATFAPQDELGLWTASAKMVKLFDTQQRNVSKMGGRTAGTSNAWDPAEHSVAQREYESGSRDVYRQMVRPPANLSYANKAERHRIHQIVYEDSLREHGGHVDLDSIEAQSADLIAKGDLPQAARFYGNMVVSGAGAAAEAEDWDRLARPQGPDGQWPDGKPPAGTYIGLGFDGSIRLDVTSLRGCLPGGYRFDIAKWVRPQGRDMLAWRDEHPGEDWRIPRDEVHSAVAWALHHYRVGRLIGDPSKWHTEMGEWAEWFGSDADGKPIVIPYDPERVRLYAQAFDRWLTAVAEGTALHDGDAVTSAHVKNLHKRKVKLAAVEDDRTRYLPVRGEDKAPIDCAIADILAGEAAATMPPEPEEPVSVYEAGGIFIL